MIFLLQTNTFQGIIITDNINTYAFYSYSCGAIQWSGQGFETAIAGYNSFRNYFSNHPANGFADIGRIISCTRQVAANQNRRKRAAGNNGAAGCPMPANPNVQQALIDCCQSFTNDGKQYSADNLDMAQRLVPACPPIRAQIGVNPMFEAQQNNCFLSRTDVVINGLVQPGLFRAQCCYQTSG